MENSYIVNTKIGQYIVKENTDINKGIKVFSIDGKPCTASASVNWWDMDAVTKFIEESEEFINERLEKLKAA